MTETTMPDEYKAYAETGIYAKPAEIELLKELAVSEGYDESPEGILTMLESAMFDGIVPGICTVCRGTQDCEPDARANWCEDCETNNVRSCLDLAGVI